MNDEFIAFKKESFDLICSNFNAHFYNDFLGFLIQSNYCLKQDGFFIGSFIGNDSLELLKQVFYEIETEKYQKFTPRFIPTTDVKTSGMMMQKANFKDVISIIEEVEISYTDPKKILLDIKNSGLSNIMFNRGKEFVTKNFLNEVYKKLENSKINNQIKINLNIVIVFGWKK
jgi:SAM-dependent methyltransferase